MVLIFKRPKEGVNARLSTFKNTRIPMLPKHPRSKDDSGVEALPLVFR
jgi:hypothetical protein